MPEYEKCKICQKEFLKYDQRGFRNAGFTAHQNKCIEKSQVQAITDDKHQKRQQRLLLPASSEPVPPVADLFPITQCDYCTPSYGMHQPQCWVLLNLIPN